MNLRLGVDGFRSDLGHMAQELRVLRIAVYDALSPIARAGFNVLAHASEQAGSIAESRVARSANRRLSPIISTILGLGLILSACAPDEASTPLPPSGTIEPLTAPLPTPDSTKTARPTIVATSTEAKVIGFGGVMSKSQEACVASKRGVEMVEAYTSYVKEYWSRLGYFGPNAQISFKPIMDEAYPDDPNKCLIVMESNSFRGRVFTLPIAQVRRYLETGDPEALLPPQGATTLLPFTDAFMWYSVVTEDSEAYKAGVPLGARWAWLNGEIVYVTGTGEDMKVVGGLVENEQWEVVEEVNMTWEDWKRLLDVEYIYPPTGEEFNVLQEVQTYTRILANSAEIMTLENHANLIIVYPSGEVQCMSTVEGAAQASDDGATVLLHTTENATNPGNVCNWFLRAMNASYLAGNRNVRMTFGENPGRLITGQFNISVRDILTDTDEDGRLITPVLEQPPHYKLYWKATSLNGMEDPVLGIEDTDHWIEEVLNRECDSIVVFAN